MSRIPDGGCQIKDSDLVDAPYTSQLTLRLLKDGGAPIIGCCVLLLDPAYAWYVEREVKYMTTRFNWRFNG